MPYCMNQYVIYQIFLTVADCSWRNGLFTTEQTSLEIRNMGPHASAVPVMRGLAPRKQYR